MLEKQGNSGRQGLECLRHLGENGDWGSVSGGQGEGAAGEAIGKDEQGKRNSGRERSGGRGEVITMENGWSQDGKGWE